MARHVYLEMAPKRTTKLHFHGYSRNLVAALVIRRDSCCPHFPVAQEDVKQQCLIWRRSQTSVWGEFFRRSYLHWMCWSACFLRGVFAIILSYGMLHCEFIIRCCYSLSGPNSSQGPVMCYLRSKWQYLAKLFVSHMDKTVSTC